MKTFVKSGKKSRFALVMGIAVAVAITFASMTGNAKGNAFRLKTAQAAFAIECDCALFGGNNNCLANNYGSQCAPDGTTDCQTKNANCGGQNQL